MSSHVSQQQIVPHSAITRISIKSCRKFPDVRRGSSSDSKQEKVTHGLVSITNSVRQKGRKTESFSFQNEVRSNRKLDASTPHAIIRPSFKCAGPGLMIGFSFFQFSRLDNKEFFLQIEFSDHELAISPNQDLMDFTAISRAETWRKGLGVTRKRITYRVPEIDAIEIYSGRIHEVRIIGKKDTEMSGRNEIISVDFRRWGCSDSWLNKLGEHLESLGIPIIDVDHSYTDAQAF